MPVKRFAGGWRCCHEGAFPGARQTTLAPFGPKGGLLRALGGVLRQPCCPREPGGASHQQAPQQLRSLCLGALGAGAGAGAQALQSLATKAGSRLLGGGAALVAGGTTAFALAQNYAPEEPQDLASDKVPWVSAIAAGVDVEEVQSPGQMLRRHPIGKLVVEQDHLVRPRCTRGAAWVGSPMCHHARKGRGA